MKPRQTLLLTREDVAGLLSAGEYITAVERAFALYGEGKTPPPGILGVPAQDGGFHIKAGLMWLDKPYFAAKVNANFPQNKQRFGLPLIQGVVMLCDGENGSPLALMDSTEITVQRTGAATAVAARYLARSDSNSLMIYGCGNQGRASLRMLSTLFSLERVFAYDTDRAQAQEFAAELSAELRLKVEAVQQPEEAVRRSDICVTCTPSHKFFLQRCDVRAGTFVAAVGADSEDKQELEPKLFSGNKIVVDSLAQCLSIGELHHAIAAGVITRNEVYGELGEVVARIKPGRTSVEEIIIFDSTGMALQDIIVAAAIYEKAVSQGIGQSIDL